jgi:uncharacterized repeat protein (TIGR03843 family)
VSTPGPELPPNVGRHAALDSGDALELLGCGRITVAGRLLDASNATLYCTIELAGTSVDAVYKPVAGERPLWDFPDGTLAGREVAAYAVSAATGWNIVPPTVHRDGPFGPGMCQLWIDVDDTVDLVALARSDSVPLRRMAVLDAVINNADRKGGHLLPTPDGHIFGVDHGVCFSVEDKLRTLLWRWRGRPLTEEAITVLQQLRNRLSTGSQDELCTTLASYLTRAEVNATRQRIERLLGSGRHPQPSEDWPAVPWPPF